MGAFERLERRNRDFLLLETIKRVGVQNYSLLSRLTGLNPETIRYKVNKHLTKLGLNTTININYGELGLSVAYLVVTPAAGGKSWLDTMSYVIFNGKILGANKHFCLCAIPFRFKKKYNDILEDLKAKKVIQDYELKDLYWVRYPPFRAELYDFEERTWKMDWNKFGLFSNEVGPSFVSLNRDSMVDFIDLKILRSLMDDPTIPLAKAAKTINANPRTVRYHNTEHVNTGKFILSSNIRWVRPMQEGRPGNLMQVVLLFRKLDEHSIERVRKFCNNLPFTWFEGGTEERTYIAVADVPMETFHDTMQKAEVYLRALDQGYETMLLDPSSSKSLGIPDEMFDKERGWRLFNLPEQASTSIQEATD
jgi:hypothetical protein